MQNAALTLKFAASLVRRRLCNRPRLGHLHSRLAQESCGNQSQRGILASMRRATIFLLALMVLAQGGVACESAFAGSVPALTCCTGNCPLPNEHSDCCKVTPRADNHSMVPAAKVGKPSVAFVGPMTSLPLSTLFTGSSHPRVLEPVSLALPLELLCSLQI